MAEGRIEITGDVELTAKLDDINLALRHNKKLMGLIGQYVEDRVKVSTAMHKDAEGTIFKEYSKPYKKVREKAGLPFGNVDLFWTGSMLSSLTNVPQDNIVRLYFMDTTDKFGMRNPKKAYFIQTRPNKERKFFAISMKDVAAIEKIVQTYVNKYLDKVIRSGGK